MEQYLAYPDEVLDSNEVDKIYQGLEFYGAIPPCIFMKFISKNFFFAKS